MNHNLSPIFNKIKEVFPRDCRRILLINPPVIPEEEFDWEVAQQKRYPVFPPYGLGIIYRKLKENGYLADIVDLNYGVLNQKEFRYSVWKDQLKQKILQFKPDLCAITCLYSMSHQSMKDVADFIKEYNRKLPVITGGVHPSAAPEFVLNDCESIDFVSLYEGDSSFITLLDFINGKTLKNKFSQIATKYKNTYIIIDNRKMEDDIASAPEFGDLPIGNYHHLGKIGAYHYLLSDEVKASTVLSNRGCRGNCTFCSVKAFYGGNGVRQRDITTVVDEMESLYKKYNIRHFMWLDDDLLFNEKRAINLFKEIARRRLNITWDASNGVVARSITPEIALAAYESGFIGLTIGIESGNPEILHSIRKPSRIKHFKRAAEILQEYPLPTYTWALSRENWVITVNLND